jgi:hypothetical protein
MIRSLSSLIAAVLVIGTAAAFVVLAFVRLANAFHAAGF